MRNSGRPHKLSTHVVKGYELVAFDIAAGVGGPERVIGWEVLGDMAAQNERPWRSPGVRSRLDELIDNNDAFAELIETLEGDRSIECEEMQQIASAFVGYEVPRSRGRGENLGDIRHRQSSNAKRWAERMK